MLARGCEDHRALGGFAGGDPVGGRGVYIERLDDRFGFEQVFQHFMDLGILLLVVAFGILLAVPKAQCQDTIRLRVRHKHGLVDEAALFFQYWYDFFVDGFGKLLGFARFAEEFDYVCEHLCAPFVVEGERNPSLARRRNMLHVL